MRKITSILAAALALCASTAVAGNTLVTKTSTNPLPGTQDATSKQYTWSSGNLSASADTKVIRLTFLENTNHDHFCGYPSVAIAELTLKNSEATKVDLQAGNLSSNMTETSEGSLEKLVNGATTKQDGESDTQWYWHSQWQGEGAAYPYLEIALPENTDLSSGYTLELVSKSANTFPTLMMVTTGTSTDDCASQVADIKRCTITQKHQLGETVLKESSFYRCNKETEEVAFPILTNMPGVTTAQAQEPTTSEILDDKSVTYTYTYDAEAQAMPFKVSPAPADGSFAEGTHWYYLRIRNTKGLTYNGETDKVSNAAISNEDTLAEGNFYAFTCPDNNGYYNIYSLAAGANKVLSHTVDSKSLKFAENATNDRWILENNSGHLVFRKPGSADYINDVDNAIGTWNAAAASTDGGGTFTFLGVDELAETMASYVKDEGGFVYLSTQDKATVKSSIEQASAKTDVVEKWNALKTVDLTSYTPVLPANGKFYYLKGGASGNYASCKRMAANNAMLQMTTAKTADNLIWQDSEGTYVFYATGQGIAGTHSQQVVGSTCEKFTYAMSAYGNGLLQVTSNYKDSKILYDAGTSLNRNSSASSVNCGWQVEEATEVPVAVTAAGYATLVAPVALTIPEGVEVFKASQSGSVMTLSPLSGTIPANLAVVVKAGEGTYQFPIAAADVAAETTSCLTGQPLTVAMTTLSGKSVYTLQQQNEVVGFYKYSGTNLLGFHASLQLDSDVTEDEAAAIQLMFGGDATGITDVLDAATQASAPMYDLSGRRIAAPAAGSIYIQNGKKHLGK